LLHARLAFHFSLGFSFGQLSNSFSFGDLNLDFMIIELGFIHPPLLLIIEELSQYWDVEHL